MITELAQVRILDVLRNTLTGELGLVMSVSGDHLELRGKSGETRRYKFAEHFARASDDEAVDFRAALRALRKAQQGEKPKRKRTASAFLNRLAKR